MSKETNNEIDLLLRRIGRRDNDGARNVAAPGEERHLEADELSSYAQNALPPAARARYMAHLAECARCRRLVTELSLSLGAATAPVEAAHEPSGWKKFLASLFSPLVLRYAVPALGVLVVMLVGFVVLQQRRQESLAQLQEPKAPVATASPIGDVSSSAGVTYSQPRESDKNENGNTVPTRRKTETAADDASGAATGAAPVTANRSVQSLSELKPAVASTPAAAPAKAAEAEQVAPKTEAAAKKEEEQAKDKTGEEPAKEATPQTTRGLYQTAPAGRTAENAPKAAEPASTDSAKFGASRALSRARVGSADRAQDEDKNNAKRAEAQEASNETRTIAGRRFRKQGGIWTDTAYDSSASTVNMARNSEQFRALVADEPAIGTIARQLEGEVIVVWKGRAYHIR